MVKIRLSRVGARGQPYYRVVVVDSRAKRDGKTLDSIGHYNPRTEPSQFDIDRDRLKYWRGVGAQVTEPVLVLLGEAKPKRHQPKNIKKEAPAQVVKAPAEKSTEAKPTPETTPLPSPELAKALEASEEISPPATEEEIAETIENSTQVEKEITQAKEKQPTSQVELADQAEIAEEDDSSTETEGETNEKAA